MKVEDWSSGLGLRRAALSLVWRGLVTMVIWCGALWSFHAGISAIGIQAVPLLITIGFCALLGTIAGVILSRNLDEVAGFVSPALALLAAVFAAGAIVGGEALFASAFDVATDHLRSLVVGVTLVVALGWIAKNTLIDS